MDAKRKIEIGLIYSAKVGGTFLPVRIDKSLGHGRYEGASQPSGKTVKVSTDAIRGDGETFEQWKAKRTPKEHPATPEPAPAPVAKTEKPKTAAKSIQKKGRKPSGLDAAVTVLAEASNQRPTVVRRGARPEVDELLHEGPGQVRHYRRPAAERHI